MLLSNRQRVRRRNLARRTTRWCDFRQPKIENLGVAALGNKNIGGLDIAVDNALGMRGVESIGNLDGQRKEFFGFHRSPSDAMLQRHAVQKLHGDERFAVLFTGNLLRQELESDETMQPRVLSLIDNTHPTAAQFLDDAIVRDGLADELGWSNH